MRALAIGVHTDDCEFGIGGILAQLSQQGWEVEIHNLSPNKFSENPEENLVKSKEAAEILGVHKVAKVPEDKNFWRNTIEHAKEVEEEINRFQPHVLFMQWFEDNHIEHVEMAKATKDAIFAASVRGWRPEEIYAYETGPMQSMYYFQPDIYINVTDEMDKIKESLLHFDLPDGEILCQEKEIGARLRGWQYRKPEYIHAECLKIMRFPREDNDFMLRKALGKNFAWCSPGKYFYGEKYLF